MASPHAQTVDLDAFKVVQLYGGGFSCSLPASFQDVSSLREVPDNQEVFVHSSCDQSVIVELVEFQSVADDQAAAYHFKDLAKSNDSSSEETAILSVIPLPKDQLAMAECSSGWLLSGTQMVSKFNKVEKSCVKILLCVLRLPMFTTDVLVTFNSPTEIAAEDDMEMFASIVRSIKLLNPSLFGSS